MLITRHDIFNTFSLVNICLPFHLLGYYLHNAHLFMSGLGCGSLCFVIYEATRDSSFTVNKGLSPTMKTIWFHANASLALAILCIPMTPAFTIFCKQTSFTRFTFPPFTAATDVRAACVNACALTEGAFFNRILMGLLERERERERENAFKGCSEGRLNLRANAVAYLLCTRERKREGCLGYERTKDWLLLYRFFTISGGFFHSGCSKSHHIGSNRKTRNKYSSSRRLSYSLALM